MSMFGKMLALEACSAGALWLFARVAPEAKRDLEARARQQLAELNPELADQLAELEGTP